MELLFYCLMMLFLVNFKDNFVCDSVPLNSRSGGGTAATNEKETLTNLHGLAVICLAWVAVAAIGWAFYYGFKKRDHIVRLHDSTDLSSYECVCCAKIPPEKEEKMLSPVEQEPLKSVPNVQLPKPSPQSIKTNPFSCTTSNELEHKSKSKSDYSEEPTCCLQSSKSKANLNQPIPKQIEYKAPQNKPELHHFVSQKAPKEHTACCGQRQPSVEEEAPQGDIFWFSEDKQKTLETKEVKKEKPSCCYSKNDSSYEIYESSVENPHSNIGKRFNEKTHLKFDSKESKESQVVIKEENNECFKCCGSKTDKRASLEGPSTQSQVSQNILQEDVRAVLRSTPMPALPVQIPRTTEIKLQVKQLEQYPVEDMSKVMRPVRTYPVKPQRDTLHAPLNNQAPANRHLSEDFVFPRHPKTIEEDVETEFPIQKSYCCTTTPMTDRGHIHPIIQGYKVDRKIRVRGEKNPGIISISEDTYDIMH